MMNNQISVVGTVATEPRLITTQSGVSLCSFRLASGERRFDKQSGTWVDGDTNWFGVSVFRAMGEHALVSFRKGDRVIVTGRLRVRQWESGDKSGTSVDIDAEALGHDLRWGVSEFTRAQEGPSDAGTAGTEEPSSPTDTAQSAQYSDANAATSSFGVSADSETEVSSDGFIPAAA